VPGSAIESAALQDTAATEAAPSVPEPNAAASAVTSQGASQRPGPRRQGRNYTWAELMRRVFELDVLECPRCLGRMEIVAAIHSPQAIRQVLDCLGLPSRAPPVAPAAPTGELNGY
jgi:hypothetical protein